MGITAVLPAGDSVVYNISGIEQLPSKDRVAGFASTEFKS